MKITSLLRAALRPASRHDLSGVAQLTDRDKIGLLLSLLNERSQPNLNALTMAVRNIDILALNIKALGYGLARELAEALPIPAETQSRHVGLGWKPSVQRDLESDWAAHWCRELHIPLFYHRKLWEVAFVLQSLHDAGHLRAGARGLGFGCGSEPMASYFASRGIASLVTDLPAEDACATGWRATHQHAASLDQAFHAHLVDRARFDALVRFGAVDMNRIPAISTGSTSAGRSARWSISARSRTDWHSSRTRSRRCGRRANICARAFFPFTMILTTWSILEWSQRCLWPMRSGIVMPISDVFRIGQLLLRLSRLPFWDRLSV